MIAATARPHGRTAAQPHRRHAQRRGLQDAGSQDAQSVQGQRPQRRLSGRDSRTQALEIAAGRQRPVPLEGGQFPCSRRLMPRG
jgi:hypothetical protein